MGNKEKREQLLKSLIKVFKDVDVKIKGTYKNNKTTIEFECRCGNIVKKRIDNIFNQPSQRFCNNCGLMNGDIKNPRECKGTKYTFEYTSKSFKELGLILLTKKIIGSSQRVSVKCVCGEEYTGQINNILYGQRCKSCKRRKTKKTCKDLYGGVGFASPELNDKSTKKAYQYKTFIWNDESVTENLQGYENYALEYLQSLGYRSDDFVNLKKEVPQIFYKHGNKTKRYFPDFYIPTENKIIEVKSDWTYLLHEEINKLKQKACLRQGYKFNFFIFNKNVKSKKWNKCLEVK